jgi:hypothetical protein
MGVHVMHMGEMRSLYKMLFGNPEKKRDHLEDRLTLNWIFKKWYMNVWTGFILLRIEPGGRLLWKQ